MVLLSLPEELILCVILRFGDLRAHSAAASTCRALQRICSEPAVWRTVTFVLPGRLQTEALRRGLAHTERLRVATVARCMGRFCKSPLGPAPGALTLAGCGGLTDAGAAALLAPCKRLLVLDLAGMAHLSGATLTLALRTFPHLKELTLRSCWQAPSGAGWADDLPEQHALRSLDLSHTEVDHLELLRLMLCTRRLGTLKLNFCEQLREGGLRHAELPSTLASLHVVGCNFSGPFVSQLESEARLIRALQNPATLLGRRVQFVDRAYSLRRSAQQCTRTMSAACLWLLRPARSRVQVGCDTRPVACYPTCIGSSS